MERNDGQQRNWLEFFAADDQRRKKRMELIDGLPIHPKAVDLLKALDDLAREALARNDETAAIRIDGTVQVSVTIGDLQTALRVRSPNTVKAYVRHAEATPYFGRIPGGNSAHNYLVRWPAIVDDHRPSSRPSVSESKRRLFRTGGQFDGQRGGQFDGQVDRQIDRQTGGRMKGVMGFSLSSLPEKNKQRNPPNPKPSAAVDRQTGANAPHRVPHDRWKRWRLTVDSADLRDPLAVEELWGMAVAFGVVTQTANNRLMFFCQAARVMRDTTLRHPRSVFALNVLRGDWFHNDPDEDRARQMLAEADLGERLPRPSAYEGSLRGQADVFGEELERSAAAASSKHEQMERLRKFAVVGTTGGK